MNNSNEWIKKYYSISSAIDVYLLYIALIPQHEIVAMKLKITNDLELLTKIIIFPVCWFVDFYKIEYILACYVSTKFPEEFSTCY